MVQREENDYRKIWSRIIPGFVISLQLSMEQTLNVAFASADESTGGKTLQCHGNDELVWRTTVFSICLILGYTMMKKFDDHQLFHNFVSFGLVTAWSLSISDFPLTCWSNIDQPLSVIQARHISLTRLLITTVVTAVAAELERRQSPLILKFFTNIEEMMPKRTTREMSPSTTGSTPESQNIEEMMPRRMTSEQSPATITTESRNASV